MSVGESVICGTALYTVSAHSDLGNLETRFIPIQKPAALLAAFSFTLLISVNLLAYTIILSVRAEFVEQAYLFLWHWSIKHRYRTFQVAPGVTGSQAPGSRYSLATGCQIYKLQTRLLLSISSGPLSSHTITEGRVTFNS